MLDGFGESFNGCMRNECFDVTLFTSLSHARFGIAAWRQDYNHVPPHSELGVLTPTEIAQQSVWGHPINQSS